MLPNFMHLQSEQSAIASDPLAAHRRASVAPMMDCTDRHYRYLARLLTKHTLLYTEMVTAGAILHGDQDALLGFNTIEQPLALQVGGSCPEALAQCARIAEQRGYDEINLNVGCPSDRVQAGRFGACLMAEPELVRDCLQSMRESTSIPVTIKTRVGIDKQKEYDTFRSFVEVVAQSGVTVFIVHARKAWLQGLSPKQNRTVPPLQYDWVYQLKREYPELSVAINGGIQTRSQMQSHLQHVDGVMIGREAYHNVYSLADFDKAFFDDDQPVMSRADCLLAYWDYCQQQLANGVRGWHLLKHCHGLCHGMQGAKYWRARVSALMKTTSDDDIAQLCTDFKQKCAATAQI